MKKVVITSVGVLSALGFSSVSYACDMHGAGYGGFGMRNAQWQAYNPEVSTIDPAFADRDLVTPMPRAVKKAKPSFSNAANDAADKARARLAKKKGAKKPEPKGDVSKAALNTDR